MVSKKSLQKKPITHSNIHPDDFRGCSDKEEDCFHLVFWGFPPCRKAGWFPKKTNLLFPENIKKDAVHLQRYFECIYLSGIIIFPNDTLITLIR